MITVKWSGYKAFLPGSHVGINALEWFAEQGIDVYRSQLKNEADTIYEIDRLPDPCPEFIEQVDGYHFTHAYNVHKVRKPLDLVKLREFLEDFYRFAEREQDYCEFVVNMDHDPTPLPDIDGHARYCEGNRSLTLSIKEYRPKSFYIERFERESV